MNLFNAPAEVNFRNRAKIRDDIAYSINTSLLDFVGEGTCKSRYRADNLKIETVEAIINTVISTQLKEAGWNLEYTTENGGCTTIYNFVVKPLEENNHV